MKTIPLSQGQVAIVDNEDFESVNHWKWYYRKKPKDRTGYAQRSEPGKTIALHRFLLNCPSGMQVDHINRNGLDNRRSNLRLCTRTQNGHNSAGMRGRASRFKGVKRARNGWRADIYYDGNKHFYLGNFDNQRDAALAYNVAAKEHFGEFAYLNPL